MFLVILSRLNYHKLKHMGHFLLILSLFGLIYLLMPGMVEEVKGSRRAFFIAGNSFRPSEVVRFALVIYLASSVSHWGKDLSEWGGYLRRLLIVGGLALLIVLQPDLSTALMLVTISLVILFIGGARMWHLMATVALLIPIAVYQVRTSQYQLQRVQDFIVSILHPESAKHQVKQSLIGLGDGGIFGLGLGGSNQKQFYLPEPFTDYPFAILGEEFGFIGTSVTLILFLVIAWRGISIALRAPDKFGFVLACGITASITLYALVNLWVVTGLLPATGMSLPFLSYGGFSLITNLGMVGILLNISRQRGKKKSSAQIRDYIVA